MMEMYKPCLCRSGAYFVPFWQHCMFHPVHDKIGTVIGMIGNSCIFPSHGLSESLDQRLNLRPWPG